MVWTSARSFKEKVGLGVTPRTVYEPDMTFFEQYREKK